MRASYGVPIMGILKKIDHIIMALHCIKILYYTVPAGDARNKGGDFKNAYDLPNLRALKISIFF